MFEYHNYEFQQMCFHDPEEVKDVALRVIEMAWRWDKT